MRTKRKERPRFSISPPGLTPAHSSTTRASVQDCLFALTRERHLARLEAAWQQPRLAIAAHRNAGSFNAACPREASCPSRAEPADRPRVGGAEQLAAKPRSRSDMRLQRVGGTRLKVTRLPFLLGHCWAQFGAVLRGGIQNSAHAYLADEPGRVFDVLLFMQGGDGRQLFRFQPGPTAWYEIH